MISKRDAGVRLVAAFALLPVTLGVALAAKAGASAAPTAGQVLSFGDNEAGELGNGTVAATSADAINPTPAGLASLPTGAGTITSLAAGHLFTLALTSTGTLLSWGDNTTLELGRTTSGDNDPTPGVVRLPGLVGLPVAISAGDYHSLVVTSSGQLFAFGDGSYGELGDGNASFGNQSLPRLVTLPSGAGTAVQAAAGGGYSLVLTSSGNVYGFGNDDAGQTGSESGSGEETTVTRAQLPTNATAVTSVVAGRGHSAFLTSNGTVFTVGENTNGELGNGTSQTTSLFTPLKLPSGDGNAVQVSLGNATTLVRTTTGAVFGYGDDSDGQLGLSTDTSVNATAVAITIPVGGDTVTDISETDEASYFTTSSGALITCGNNADGQLGRTTTTTTDSNLVAAGIPGGATIGDVAKGPYADHNLAFVSDLAVNSTSLPAGTVGSPYSTTAPISGGIGAVTATAAGLPAGLSMSPGGAISGTPTTAGNSSVTVTATDADGVVAIGSLSLTVGAAPAAPAKLVTPALPVSPGSPAAVAGASSTALKNAVLAAIVPLRGGASYSALKAHGYQQTLAILEPGRVSITWSYQPPKKHAKAVVVATGRATFTKTGLSHLTVHLTKAGSALLKLGHRVTILFGGSFVPAGHQTALLASKTGRLA